MWFRSLPVLCIILVQYVHAQQTGDYRSAGIVDLNNAANWQTWNGTAWEPAALPPNGHVYTGNTITVLTGDEWHNSAGASIPAGVTMIHQGVTGTFSTAVANKISISGAYVHNTVSSVAALFGGIVLATGSRFIYRGSATLTPAVSFSNRTYYHLRLESVSGNLSLNLAGFAGGSNPFTVQGDLELGAGVTLNQNTFTGALQFQGNIHIAGTMRCNSFSIATGKTLTLANTGIIYVPAGQAVTAEGVLDAGKGRVEGPGNLLVNGTLKTAHPAGLSATGTLQHTGNTVYAAAAMVCYNAPDSQLVAGMSYPQLSFSNAGVKLLQGAVSVAGNLAVSGGPVQLGAYDLTVAGTATSDGVGYVQTNGTGAMQMLSVMGARHFPVGNSTYNPVMITHAEGLHWRVRVADSLPNTQVPFYIPRSVNRCWHIEPSGPPSAGADLRFQYNDADPAQKNAQFLVNEVVQAWHYHNGSWMSASLGIQPDGGTSAGIKLVTLPGQLQFSPFALANLYGTLPLHWLYVRARPQPAQVRIEFAFADEGNTHPEFALQLQDSYGAFHTVPLKPVKEGASKGCFYIPDFLLGNSRCCRIRAAESSGHLYYSAQVRLSGTDIQKTWITQEHGILLHTGQWPPGSYHLFLMDVNGRVLKDFHRTIAPGADIIFLAASLPPGYYIVKWNGPVNGCRSFTRLSP